MVVSNSGLAPVQIECRVEQLIPVGRGPDGNTLILGEVLAYHIREDVFDAERKRIRLDRLKAVGRLAGDGYCRTRDQFELIRDHVEQDAAQTAAS